MAIKERLQSPVTGDTITLRQFVFNSNGKADPEEFTKVEIWYCDPAEVTEINPDGRRLIETIEAADITRDDVGEYNVSVATAAPLYNIGKYVDIWFLVYEAGEALENRSTSMESRFEIFPDLWYTTEFPVVYDFEFRFTPNRVRKGSCKFLQVEIIPNVPRASDLERYYENLAIYTDLLVSIEQKCGDCLPAERDLRLIADCESVDYSEKCVGFYRLDTTDLDCGIYDIWFTLNFGDNTYVSDSMQLQIYD